MISDKKQPVEDAGTKIENPLADTIPATNNPEKEGADSGDWVAVGSGLGIDE